METQIFSGSLSLQTEPRQRVLSPGAAPDQNDGKLKPILFRIPLTSIAQTPPSPPDRVCPRCGNRWLAIHQTTSKTILDIELRSVPVVRYRCYECHTVARLYPSGIDKTRQSLRLKELTVALYCIGLTYPVIHRILVDLGCPLSMTSIRHNVILAYASQQPGLPEERERMRLAPAGKGQLSGTDGSLTIRLARQSACESWLEIEIIPKTDATAIIRRVESCARGPMG